MLVDGVDVREFDPEALWRRIGLVPQKAFLFSGTVASNLRYGNADATDDELWDALTVAQARDFVEAMPGGLDAPITQGGTNVSGGQRQRLAIARALVHRPEIYLFDESFSALDLGTDARLRAALRPVTRDAAVIVIASRISTIVDADQIVVLEAGRVVGLGRHDELLETCADVRRDRRVAALGGGRGMSRPDHQADAKVTPGRLPAAGGEARRGGGPPWMGAAMPAEKAMTFGPSAKRLLRLLRPARRPLVLVLALAVLSVAMTVIGPKLLGHATDLIFKGFLGSRLPDRRVAVGRRGTRARRRQRQLRRTCCCARTPCPASASTSARWAQVLLIAAALYLVAAVFGWLQGYLLNDVVQNTVRRLRSDVEAKLHRRAAAVRRLAGSRRTAQPRHQRHRQRRAVAAADAEPAAHVAC